MLAPGLVVRARDGSTALLGAAFAVCAAPCVGAVLGSVLVLASATGTVAKGIVLLTAYSLGLGGRVPARRRCVRARDDRLSRVARQLGDDPHRQRLRRSSRSACSSSSTGSGGSTSAYGASSTPSASARSKPAHRTRSSALDLREQRRDVDSPVTRGEGREPPRSFLELPAAARLVPAAVLVPGDDDVHEPLEEVALFGRSGAPGVFERLVRLEVPPRAGEREAVCERLLDHERAVLPFGRGDDPAVWGRPLLSGQTRCAAPRPPPDHDRERRPAGRS